MDYRYKGLKLVPSIRIELPRYTTELYLQSAESTRLQKAVRDEITERSAPSVSNRRTDLPSGSRCSDSLQLLISKTCWPTDSHSRQVVSSSAECRSRSSAENGSNEYGDIPTPCQQEHKNIPCAEHSFHPVRIQASAEGNCLEHVVQSESDGLQVISKNGSDKLNTSTKVERKQMAGKLGVTRASEKLYSKVEEAVTYVNVMDKRRHFLEEQTRQPLSIHPLFIYLLF